ncbi:hypothetical protein VUR80DRAFT_6698 [Thermomyces stellatus]
MERSAYCSRPLMTVEYNTWSTSASGWRPSARQAPCSFLAEVNSADASLTCCCPVIWGRSNHPQLLASETRTLSLLIFRRHSFTASSQVPTPFMSVTQGGSTCPACPIDRCPPNLSRVNRSAPFPGTVLRIPTPPSEL